MGVTRIEKVYGMFPRTILDWIGFTQLPRYESCQWNIGARSSSVRQWRCIVVCMEPNSRFTHVSHESTSRPMHRHWSMNWFLVHTCRVYQEPVHTTLMWGMYLDQDNPTSIVSWLNKKYSSFGFRIFAYYCSHCHAALAWRMYVRTLPYP